MLPTCMGRSSVGVGGSTVRTGQQTPTIDPPLWTPHKKTIIIMTVRDLTSCLANLCIRCRPPIASTILFGSFPRVFIDSSQASQNSAPLTTKDADIHFVRSGYSLKNTCCVQLNILLWVRINLKLCVEILKADT